MTQAHVISAVIFSCAISACTPSSSGVGSTGTRTHSLTLKVQGGGTGRIQGAGATDCRSSCTAQLAAGTQLTLVAVADAGSSFAGWTGDCSGSDACKITLDADRTATATFSPLPPPPLGKRLLTVAKTGSGKVTSAPAGIDCGSTCSAAFDDGATVNLSATPDASFHFAGFAGPCSGPACKLTLSSNALVEASFEADAAPPPPPPGMHSLAVTRSGSGSGSVASSPAGIDCGGKCSASFNDGAQVTLAAAAASGSRFTGWGGACSGTDVCTVTLHGDASVDAGFEPLPPDECAALQPRPLPSQVTASISTSEPCGSGTSDGAGRVGVFTSGDPYFTSQVGIYQPNGNRLSLTGLNHRLVGPLLEQLQGFTGTEFDYHSSIPFSLAPDGTETDAAGVGGLAVLDPLGGMVVDDVPYGGTSSPRDTYLASYDAKAKLRWRVSLGRQRGGPVGADRQGNILMLFPSDGRLMGQWADHDGNLGAVFDLGADPNATLTLVPRVGSGFFVHADPDDWILQFDSGSTTPSPAPGWLSSRHQKKIHMAYGGTAYALIDVPQPAAPCTQRIEIVAPSGKSCGALDFPIQEGRCNTLWLDVGYDGTVIQALPQAQSSANECTWRWWPAVLR